ncbi:MAG: cold shock and DUF1294 domain-containing protein [Burkholderiaceae bacterium]|nr:cold shock and DUF1294 domain-containing protein [Burkholderiaceae bacterium]
MRFEGVIRCWNDERGFGFIEPTLGGQEVFVHMKAFARGAARPTAGQRVSFEVELGPQGKKRACKVQPVRPARLRARGPQHSAVRYGGATLFAIPAFLVVYVAVGVLWRPPAWLAWGYLAASVATFAAYGRDKSSAQRSGWRISESKLHALSLAGGWPGALLAQQLLRHKSAKAEFRAVFWRTVVVNVAAFLVLSSPIGRRLWAVL